MKIIQRRVLGIGLAIMMVSASLAHPQESANAPHGRPAVTQTTKQDAGPGQYPTKDAPLPVTTSKGKEEQKSAASQEDATNKYNGDYLASQNRIAEATEKQSSTTRAAIWIACVDTFLTAIALVFLIFTYRQTKQMASAATNAVKVARAEFDASHRPKLIMRQIEFTGFDPNDANRMNMRCAIVNVGDGEGHVVNGRYHLEFSDGEQFDPIEDGDAFESYVIPPGGAAYIVMALKMNEGAALMMAQADSVAGAPRPYFRGYLSYVDRNNIGRRTYFSRCYEPGTGRFMPTNDSDYDREY
jgi:hypothetical protein